MENPDIAQDRVAQDRVRDAEYEAPNVARVPLEEGTVFTAAIVSNSMAVEW